ncbi:unnamed protein product, partial [Meganyctiphanes norvegica]
MYSKPSRRSYHDLSIAADHRQRFEPAIMDHIYERALLILHILRYIRRATAPNTYESRNKDGNTKTLLDIICMTLTSDLAVPHFYCLIQIKTNSLNRHRLPEGSAMGPRYKNNPISCPRDSLLTWTSGFEKFDGFYVWAVILLTMGGTRLFLENVNKYGIQVSPESFLDFVFSQGQDELFYRTPMFLILFNFHYLFVYYLEHELAKGKISSSRGTVIHVVHLVLVVLIPAVLMLCFPNMFSLLGRCIICCFTWISVFKIWSYIQVNKWCRRTLDAQKKKKFGRSKSFRTPKDESDDEEEEAPVAQSVVKYPNNLTLSDLYYFLLVPTLCYELNYPRSQRIRRGFLLKRIFEVILMINVQLAMVQQWVIPSVKNSFKAFAEMDYLSCIERILKLAIPNHLLWLIFFYIMFHSFLNVLAEILRFGDRKFYEDWWNARDVGTFWRLWNFPFHKWAVRHMYIPMLKSKYSRTSASVAVFLLSAIFHEYLVSVPLRMYKVLTFLAFIGMIPLVYISTKVADRFGDRFGNAIVWLFLILGQPAGLLVYYHDYIVKNYSVDQL